MKKLSQKPANFGIQNFKEKETAKFGIQNFKNKESGKFGVQTFSGQEGEEDRFGKHGIGKN